MMMNEMNGRQSLWIHKVKLSTKCFILQEYLYNLIELAPIEDVLLLLIRNSQAHAD